jgi:hypothetical protein
VWFQRDSTTTERSSRDDNKGDEIHLVKLCYEPIGEMEIGKDVVRKRPACF